MKISEHEMTRRRLYDLADGAIVHAMDEFAKQHGSLTTIEWVAVLASATRRWANFAKVDEWRQEESED